MTSPRRPNTYDYIAFYVAIPLLYGIVAAPFAVPPRGEVDLAVVAYVCFRSIAFWVIIDLACRCIGHTVARYRLSVPLWTIFISGFLLAGMIIYLFVFVALQAARFKNPDIASFIGRENMGWNIAYVLTVAGYALPAFILWFVAAYGYRRVFNVELFSYAPATVTREEKAHESPSDSAGESAPGEHAPAFLSDSRLSAQSEVQVIKAEEHYIRVWTDHGSDLLRYRFKDAVNELNGVDGLQVHRSWWVRLSSVEELKSRGRKAELRIRHADLVVPVSLSYKQALLHALELRDNPADLHAGGGMAS